MEKITIGVMGDGLIDAGYQTFTQFLWNVNIDKFRYGPRTTAPASTYCQCHGPLDFWL